MYTLGTFSLLRTLTSVLIISAIAATECWSVEVLKNGRRRNICLVYSV